MSVGAWLAERALEIEATVYAADELKVAHLVAAWEADIEHVRRLLRFERTA